MRLSTGVIDLPPGNDRKRQPSVAVMEQSEPGLDDIILDSLADLQVKGSKSYEHVYSAKSTSFKRKGFTAMDYAILQEQLQQELKQELKKDSKGPSK